MSRAKIAVIYRGDWKLHVEKPKKYRAPSAATLKKGDMRVPDGTYIIAPFEQELLSAFPGLKTGDAPKRFMLFNIADDPGEQKNLSKQYPELVDSMKKEYEEIKYKRITSVPGKINTVPKSTPYLRIKGGQLDFWNMK